MNPIADHVGAEKNVGALTHVRPTLCQQWIDHILKITLLAPLFKLLSSGRFLDRAAAGLFGLVVLFTVAFAAARPDYNWDMVAYVATALESEYTDAATLHEKTWSLIDADATQAQQYHLKQSNPYNLHQWQNPVDFQSQLSMYRVKIGYIATLRALEPLVGLVNASVLLSLLPSLIIGLLSLRWLWQDKALQGAFILMPILLLAGYLSQTMAVTPDMLVTCLSLIAVYCLYRQHDWVAVLFLIIGVLVRPDNFVLIIALTMVAFLFGWKKAPMIVAFCAAIVLMAIMSKSAGHPGWWPHFYFSTVQIQNSMVDFHPAFSTIAFAKGYARGISVSLTHNDWPYIYVLLLSAWALLHKAGYMVNRRANALCFAMVIGVLGKFASFPLPDDRYYFLFIAGFSLLLMSAWKPKFQFS